MAKEYSVWMYGSRHGWPHKYVSEARVEDVNCLLLNIAQNIYFLSCEIKKTYPVDE